MQKKLSELSPKKLKRLNKFNVYFIKIRIFQKFGTTDIVRGGGSIPLAPT